MEERTATFLSRRMRAGGCRPLAVPAHGWPTGDVPAEAQSRLTTSFHTAPVASARLEARAGIIPKQGVPRGPVLEVSTSSSCGTLAALSLADLNRAMH